MSEISVTGVGVVTALGVGVEKNILAMRNCTTGISSRPAILNTKLLLPVGELRLSNRELSELLSLPFSANLPRTALLGILAVREAVNSAGISLNSRIALVSASSVAGMDLTENFYKEFVKDNTKGRLRNVRMHDCGTIAHTIAKYSGITGYVSDISTACSSAANAIIYAAKLLKHNIVDCVVAGGCDALSLFTLNGFNALKILDENICRPFDESRSGLNLGEGAGYIVMQRADSECQSRFCSFASGVNANDAFHQTASSDLGNGPFIAMSKAVAEAGISVNEVSYINAHGTATVNNDASESVAFTRLFGNKVPPFSSTKAFTGHTLAACGGVEAVFAALAVKNGFLYPNLNFSVPIEKSGLKPVACFRKDQNIDCVMSNSFGFGGNCSSLIFKK